MSVPTANAQGQRFDSDGLCWDDNEICKALTKYRNRVRKEEAELKAFAVILKALLRLDDRIKIGQAHPNLNRVRSEKFSPFACVQSVTLILVRVQ